MTRLNGITWGHSRGYTPLVACSQAWTDLYSDIEIEWQKRSLWAFGEGALEELLGYDLLVMDHPFTGRAAEAGLLLAVDEYPAPDLLSDISDHSVGPSFRSYHYESRLWVLPVDAAAQVSVARADLLQERGLNVPRTWQEVMHLAEQHGGVSVPLSPINALSCLFTLMAQAGHPATWTTNGIVLERAAAGEALDRLRRLARAGGPHTLSETPIQVLNRMSGGNDILYVPLCFGYTNYSRPGFAPHLLTFRDMPRRDANEPRGSCLGGAGIAVNRHSANRNEAARFALWVCSGDCQSTLYVTHGGQPAHAAAWDSAEANRTTGDFFTATRRTLELAYMRPNFPTLPVIQEKAAGLVHAHLRGEIAEVSLLDRLSQIA